MEKLSFIIVVMLIMTAVTVQSQPSQNQPESTKIEFKDLPKSIADQVKKDYSDYRVANVFKVVRSARNINYRVVLVKGQERLSLTYNMNGKFLNKVEMTDQVEKNEPVQSQPESAKIDLKDLPKNIAAQVKKDYAGYEVTNVFKVVRSANRTDYRVLVVKGQERLSLIYDSSGKLIRKVDMNADTDK